MTKSVTGNRRYIRFPLYSHQIWTVEWSYQPITGRFFSSFVISPPQESFVKLWKWASEKYFICSKLGPDLLEISGSQDICQDTESKKEASFSFARGTPHGEWLLPCYVVCSVFFVMRAWQAWERLHGRLQLNEETKNKSYYLWFCSILLKFKHDDAFFCWCVVTLVTEVFLDFSPHERAARKPQSGEHESRLIFAASQKKKNQEKCLGPG